MSVPEIYSRWKHENGNEYNVILIANENAPACSEYPIVVIYRGDNGNVWAKNIDNFNSRMTRI